MLEIRVHGIGDHKELSALGVGTELQPNAVPGAQAYLPPPIPDHALVLVNWSRASRLRASLLWYLSLPFSLVNIAAQMSPPGRTAWRRTFPIAVWTAGLAVTLTAVTWLVAIIETVLKRAPWLDPSSRDTKYLCLAIVGTVLVAAISRMRTNESLRTWPSLLHLGIAVGYLIAVLWVKPAARFDWAFGWTNYWVAIPTSCSNVSGWQPGLSTCLVSDSHGAAYTMTNAPDFLVAAVALLGGVTLVTAIVAGIAGGGRGTVRTPSAAGGGAALAITMAGLLVNGFGSAMRLGVDWLTLYLNHYNVPGSDLAEEERTVLVRTNGSSVFLADTIATYVAMMLIGLGLATLSVIWVQRKVIGLSDLARLPAETLSRRRTHAVVLGLPSILPYGFAAGIMLGLVLVAGTYLLAFDPSHAPGWVFAIVVSLTHLAALGAVLFLASRAGHGKVRQLLARAADVIGFWPPTSHPLAGASYRQGVMDRLAHLVDAAPPAEPIVLVGHSQGSVLVAWAVSKNELSHPQLAVLTCGCPLLSLYSTLFPSTFDATFYQPTRQGRPVPWMNYWRATDPIGTALPARTEGPEPWLSNVELVDDFLAPKGHNQYWTEPQLIAGVLALATTPADNRG